MLDDGLDEEHSISGDGLTRLPYAIGKRRRIGDDPTPLLDELIGRRQRVEKNGKSPLKQPIS